mgnify:CR=1 FL=1
MILSSAWPSSIIGMPPTTRADTIASARSVHEGADTARRVGLRNEPVEGRWQGRSALCAIDLEVAADLVDLVLDQVEWRDLE